MTIRVGCSGFSYRHWQGVFYPAAVPQRRWLEYYAGQFDTLELNTTFYHLPTDATFHRWHDRVPPGFIYAVKLSRYITHTKKLHEVDESLDRFLHGARLLGDCLGPILVQLPPNMAPNVARLEAFLALCDPALRWAVEFRHQGWLQPAVFAVLRRYRAALCLHDMLPDHPREITAPFVYLRFHGAQHIRYGGSYPDPDLAAWARHCRSWAAAGHDVYAYFNNDQAGYAVQNALTLRGMIERLGRRAA